MTYRDLLEETPPPTAQPVNPTALLGPSTEVTKLLSDIRRQLLKNNPDVLTQTRVQNGNTIAMGDSGTHQVFFEVANKRATIYRLLIYSTFSGTVSISITGMARLNDGIPFAAGDLLMLDIAVESIYLVSDGSADLPVNLGSDATDGALYIYGFTIPDSEDNR